MKLASAFALTLLLFGCAWLPGDAEPEAAPLPPPPARASLSVEVWRGFDALPAHPVPDAPHVELVVDLSRSMRAESDDGPLRLYGARESAARLVERLPDEATVEVHVLGVSKKSPCSDATRVASGEVATLRELLPGRLRGLWPGGEGSLAETLDAIARDRAEDEPEARVVAFSDLDASCGGDLCAAAEALVASGAQLELVVFGPAQAPACLAELTAPPSPWVPGLEAPKPARFEVVEIESGNVVTRGRADGQPVALPAGPALLRLEVDPPVELGRLVFAEDTHSRVHLLDFPALQPPVREWRWKLTPMPASSWTETEMESPTP